MTSPSTPWPPLGEGNLRVRGRFAGKQGNGLLAARPQLVRRIFCKQFASSCASCCRPDPPNGHQPGCPGAVPGCAGSNRRRIPAKSPTHSPRHVSGVHDAVPWLRALPQVPEAASRTGPTGGPGRHTGVRRSRTRSPGYVMKRYKAQPRPIQEHSDIVVLTAILGLGLQSGCAGTLMGNAITH